MEATPTVADRAFELGDVLHSCCDCCEHAAKRTMGLREAIENAIRGIEAGFPGETMYELDRVLACLNEWCNAPPPEPYGGVHADDSHPF